MRNLRRLLPAAVFVFAACTSTAPPPPAAAPAAQPTQTEEPPATRPERSGTVSIPARGLSCRTAIPLAVTSETEGVAREDAWIAENYPGATKAARTQTACDGKTVDQINLDTANGRTVSLFFENSGWTTKPK